jgi:hypothetical protein
MSEPVMGTSGAGTVVLDLGAGIGALVLYTPAALDGEEIEISRAGHPRTHSRVRPRQTSAGLRYAAVYPGLPAGDYTIWHPAAPPGDDHPVTTISIAGGTVTTCHWPD